MSLGDKLLKIDNFGVGSFRQKPESSYLAVLDPGFRRGDGLKKNL